MLISLCRNVCCRIFGFLLKISVLLSHPSVPHPAGDTAEIWWLLSGPGQSCGSSCIVWEVHSRAWQEHLPCLLLCHRSVPAHHWLRSVVPQRKSCFSHCVSPLPTFPLLSHCASKARGVCTEVLLWALCKLSPGSSLYSYIRRRNPSLELDAGYWGSGKGLCFLLSDPDFPMEPIVHQRWG